MGATFFFMYIAPFLETLYDVKTVIRITSSFISIAGDMNRIRRGDYNFLWKVISVPLFLIFGALALYTAIAVWLLRVGDDMKQYSVSELDVVGTAFARSGVCLCFARQIFDEIHDRYVETDDMKHAESYALACKWMMYVTPNKTDVYKGEIKRIQKKYPDFPNEIMVRLNEALTM